MAEQLKTFEFSRGNRKVYAQWLDGNIWKVKWAEETDCKSVEAFRSGLYTAGRNLDMRVRTQIASATEVVVQATPRGD